MQKVCRLCLQAQQRDMTSLFSDDVNDDECRQMRLQIADLCSIVILQNDSLPKLICCKCKVKLQDAHEFVKLCKISNDRLLEYCEEDKHCQTEKAISARGRKRKSTKEKKRKCAGESLRSVRKSLRVHSSISNRSETYNPMLLQDKLSKNVEVEEKESDNVESDFNSKIRETLREEQVYPSVHCDKVADNNEKQYLCDVCNKTFASISGLRFHLKSHYGSKPHTCQYCGKSFAIPSYRKRHERTHMGVKLFVCHICSTAFASSNGLKYHLRTHTGEANYCCETCGKAFARYKYLKEHTFTHTGEKPFVCKLCGSAYGNSGSLFVHEKKCKSRQNALENC